MFSKTPAYNLSAVLHEVGLSADILRAWERRYQLPVPQRTSGGHRLYSQYDIETIKWLKDRQEDGLSISRAVSLWRDTAAKADPLEGLPVTLPTTFTSTPPDTTPIEHLRQSWIDSCLGYDSIKAENTLNQALSIFSLEKVCVQVIQQGLSDIGEKWYNGSATAQQEHFATALAHNRIQTLIAGTPKPLFNKTILIGCPPTELHTLPGLLLTLFLRREGMNVVYLGADIPTGHLIETSNQVKPDLVVLTAQRLATAKTLANAANQLNSQNFSVGYGGLIFTRVPELVTHIDGHYLGNALDSSIGRIKALVLQPESTVISDEISPDMKKLSKEFDERRALIEYRIVQILRNEFVKNPFPIEIVTYMADDLSAALALGNLSFMDQDIAWVKNLGRRMDSSSSLLPAFLQVYQKAVLEELGSIAAPISNWLFSTYSLIDTKEKV